MARYSLAAALVLARARATSWSYLPVTMPTPLSDMSVVSLVVGEGNSTEEEAKTRIFLTGGCDR